MTRVLSRLWIPVLVVVVATVGAVAVTNARTVFGSNPVIVTQKTSDSAEDFDPKVVTYEVFGSGATAVVNYVDLDGRPQRTGSVTLPWSVTLTTTNPSASPNVLVQGDGDSIGCRITVDDVVKEERTATGMNAATYCLVKSA
ncbi:MmpS family transport accessory protein [Mycobacterium sp. DL592]|uniref:MmpS family transport accessory protein n=1 Tax=Mycobacterium sp. DL592 TaxID=2675524 RepID=UPI00142214A0|nr:MmpS family transport accessory protein [Mycobacterium sp. DL592]